jgi:uncharacterized protein (TIGR02453 family)
MTSTFAGFGKDLIKYYLQLEENNNREWFHSHRAMYDENVAFPLKKLAKDLSVDYAPVKIFRPYRNVRFWPDLPPLNEHASLTANAEANSAYYLRIDADGMLLGAGNWQPSKTQLASFRSIASTQAGARVIRSLLEKLQTQAFELSTDNALKSAPRGYAKDHPNIDLLRLKSLSLSAHFAPEPWLYSSECLNKVLLGWQTLAPWIQWLRSNLPPE